MKENMQEIARRIRTRREDLDYSFQDLAEMTGMSKSTLQRYETGGIQNIPLSKLEPLAQALHMTQAEIMGWDIKESVQKSSNNAGLNYLSSRETAILDGYRQLNEHNKKTTEILIERLHQSELLAVKNKPKPVTQEPRNEDDDEAERQLPLFEYPASAGVGVFAGEGEYSLVDVPDDVPYDATFAVRISGNSMEPKIPDGSIVWVRQQPVVDDGDICIATVNDEGYCKVKEGNKLVSINSNYGDVRINSGDIVRISGKIVYIEKP